MGRSESFKEGLNSPEREMERVGEKNGEGVWRLAEDRRVGGGGGEEEEGEER